MKSKVCEKYVRTPRIRRTLLPPTTRTLTPRSRRPGQQFALRPQGAAGRAERTHYAAREPVETLQARANNRISGVGTKAPQVARPTVRLPVGRGFAGLLSALLRKRRQAALRSPAAVAPLHRTPGGRPDGPRSCDKSSPCRRSGDRRHRRAARPASTDERAPAI